MRKTTEWAPNTQTQQLANVKLKKENFKKLQVANQIRNEASEREPETVKLSFKSY